MLPARAMCPSCACPNAPGARFCRSCGAAVASALGPPMNLEPTDTPPGPAARRWPLVVAATAVMAALLLGIGLMARRSGRDTAEPPPRRDSPAETTTTTRSEDTNPSTTTRAPPPAVVAPTTSTPPPAATTLPPTTTIDAPSAAAIPAVPVELAPLNSPGSPQVMSDPLPSGHSFATVQPSFAVAQQFADALALADWRAARALDPGTASLSDEAFVDGYGGLDRASLLLMDARPSGAGDEMLVVSVAVELDGTRTSLYCLTWIADPISVTVDQGGGSKLTELTGNVSPEAIRNDSVALGEVGRCVWR